MSKARKNTTPKIGMKDIDPRFMRVNQRATRIPDGRKAQSQKACRRGKAGRGGWD